VGLAALAVLSVGCSSGDHGQSSAESSTPLSDQQTSTSTASADPRSVALPPVKPGDAQATKSFLATGGKLLLTFRSAIAPLIDVAPTADPSGLLSLCTSVAESLSQVQPNDVLTAAQRIPDPILAELYLSERRVVSDGLVACGQKNLIAQTTALQQLDRTEILMGRRLKELGL
jgi:hypothetical protein